jgi:hypothetical protein
MNRILMAAATPCLTATPPRYQASWLVTRDRGKWYIQVEFPLAEARAINFPNH